jgi:hypothetical protein
MPVAVLCEFAGEVAEVDVVHHQDAHQEQLGVHPRVAAADAVLDQERAAEEQRKHRRRRHDAVEQAALHHLEALDTDGVGGTDVVNEQSRQIENACEPGDDEDDVEGLDPEHARRSGEGKKRRERSVAESATTRRRPRL